MDENGLYIFHKEMADFVKKQPSQEIFNFHRDLTIPTKDLERITIINVSEEAAQWRESKPAEDMYFSHGQYYGDGIKHIIRELKNKPTSNRALYSLLAQSDISKSGDTPIPSFLTFQCSIESNTLYCTASFRALEVDTFLKINLEEIRQNLMEICHAFPSLKNIKLHIFAFHAYARAGVVAALRRPKINVMSDAELLRQMQRGEMPTLDALLGELEKSTTAVSSEGLKSLLKIMQMTDAALHSDFESIRGLLVPQLEHAINTCHDLAAFREGASRGENNTARIEAFRNALQKLRNSLLQS